MDRCSSVDHLDFYISPATLQEGALSVIKRVKPDWKGSDIEIKIFTDGITNRLLGGYLKSGDGDDMVLIRVYGEKTELFIDRSTEVRNMKCMYKAGLSSQLYCTFENGVCYGFAPGRVLDEYMVRDSVISRHIGDMLARMHTIRPFSQRHVRDQNHTSFNQPEPCLFPGLRKFLELMPLAFVDAKQNERFKKYVPRKEKLILEVDRLESHLKSLNSPIVFCHNDLLLKNIIYNDKKDSVTFIDFEYGDYNYQAYDLGNHFCEFAGVDTYNPSLYPNKEFQMKWLKNYLEAWYSLKHKDDMPKVNLDAQVEKLYMQVNKFALAAHLYWGFWAIVQAAHSSIEFDFLGYSIQRLHEYYSRRDQLLLNGNGIGIEKNECKTNGYHQNGSASHD